MRETANFCDVCKAYVADETKGVIIAYDGTGVINRIFDKALDKDVCLCGDCIDDMKRKSLLALLDDQS